MSSSSLFLIPFMLTCSEVRFLLPLLLGLCPCVVSVVSGRLWSVFEVVEVPYVDAVVAVTAIRALLFVLNECILRVCEDARVTTMLV